MMKDKNFIEKYKPLLVPAHFNADDSLEDKIIFTLAQLGSATSEEVGYELAQLENNQDIAFYQKETNKYLLGLYNEGLIKGIDSEDGLRYDLSKIERANSGSVDTNLLE